MWLDRDLVARLRALSRDLVTEHGRAGNSIEAMVTEGIEHILEKHGRGLVANSDGPSFTAR